MVMIDEVRGSTHRTPDERGVWVVGIDGSTCSTNALAWAAANSPGRAAELELVTAWQAPVVGASAMSGPMTQPFADDELHDRAAADLSSLATDLDDRIELSVTAAVGRGGPAEVLLEASSNASMLVIGSRGRGGFARLLLGSTSTQCATHANVPTVVVPSEVETVRVDTMLVGFDGSPNSIRALTWAMEFAAPDTTIVVAWVWDATPLAVGADAFFFPDASDLAAERFHHLVESVESEHGRDDITVVREFLRGTPRSALAEHAEHADLVVVGARGHGVVGAALLGSVSTWLLHHVHRPIAVIPLPG